MIKVEVNKGNVSIKEMEGTAVNIMTELCCLVKAVCMSWSEDEPFSSEIEKQMILGVAHALESKEESLRGVKLEDDENADF